LRREEIKFQVALINPLVHIKGYGAPEVKAAVERAQLLIERAEALGEQIEDPLLLFSVVYGLWIVKFLRFDGDALRELAAQFLALAKKQGTAAPLMAGHRLMAVSLASTGDLAQGRAYSDQALALYDPIEHRALATRFGADSRVSIVGLRSLILWFLGYPEAALADSGRAVSDARESGQAPALMFALYHTGLTHAFCGNHTTALTRSNELIALADEKGALFWKTSGMLAEGLILVLTGKASGAIEMLGTGFRTFPASGGTVWTPLFQAYLTRAYAALNQFDHAWRCIREALSTIETTKERWCEAEVNRIAGEITLMSPEPDAKKAETYFDRALAIAREQQAKSWELRAGMSIARLWRDQGKRQQAHDLLAPIYGWYTEGFDTLDLKEAKALLSKLSS
jgi:predicted ATPase